MRRFGKSPDYLETIYKPIVDAWYMWESREGGFILVEHASGGVVKSPAGPACATRHEADHFAVGRCQSRV